MCACSRYLFYLSLAAARARKLHFAVCAAGSLFQDFPCLREVVAQEYYLLHALLTAILTCVSDLAVFGAGRLLGDNAIVPDVLAGEELRSHDDILVIGVDVVLYNRRSVGIVPHDIAALRLVLVIRRSHGPVEHTCSGGNNFIAVHPGDSVFLRFVPVEPDGDVLVWHCHSGHDLRS